MSATPVTENALASSVSDLQSTVLREVRTFVFPVQDDVRDDESGQGYALRMAQANGLDGLPQLKRWLGKSRFASLDLDDVQLLSQWFGARPQRLGARLGSIATGKGQTEFRYAGHLLGRSYFLNRMSPRVCPLCIEEHGHCKSAWDFALMTDCPTHRCALLESCLVCARGLSWNRPRLDACQCGWAFNGQGSEVPPTDLSLRVSAWLCDQLDERGVGASAVLSLSPASMRPGEQALLNLVRPLSLNGGLHLLYALASAERSLRGEGEPFERKKASSRAARAVVEQAGMLVARIQAGEILRFRPSGVRVVTQLLAQTASHQREPADRSLAHSIIREYLRQRAGRSNWTGLYPQLSQFELFVE